MTTTTTNDTSATCTKSYTNIGLISTHDSHKNSVKILLELEGNLLAVGYNHSTKKVFDIVIF